MKDPVWTAVQQLYHIYIIYRCVMVAKLIFKVTYNISYTTIVTYKWKNTLCELYNNFLTERLCFLQVTQK